MRLLEELFLTWLLLAFFAYLNFYFAKTGKNGLNDQMEQKKSREKSLDLYEDWSV